ncbi:MAG: pyridoxamine 5'-phosphate oxidase family protein [Gordonia sp. (in: high G+C Gram-positive bacteria)]|uniref:pyridoxamine 5'-phosphate oxidase family protein n=1 Tax=Gordonia sp. (in: high G+C Gram-positive bacteria) TaxID=84139 RepID=UPI0039E5AD46
MVHDVGMTSWADFHSRFPELADTVRRTFAVGKHATMATVRRDGGPRISGTEVDFADDGRLYLGMMPGARRADDLRRDPRVAVHCPTQDPPPDDPAGWLGDGKIAARAVEVEPDRFQLDIMQVVLTRVAPGAEELEITVWTPERGVTVTRRR